MSHPGGPPDATVPAPLPDLGPRPAVGPATYGAYPPAAWPVQAAVPPGGYAGPLRGAQPDEVERARSRAATALGWAIGAAVAAGVAIILAVVALVVSAAGGGALDDGSYEALAGQVSGFSGGAPLSGDRLEQVLENGIRDFGGDVTELDCPDTASVSTSSVVVCTGEVDGYAWTGAVFFEDSAGSFVVAEF